MQCPFCQAHDTKVVDSRLVLESGQVRRRRECTQCSERFTTYESVELTFPRVIKQNGFSEAFNLEKLKIGFLKALEKRPFRIEQVDLSISRILAELRGLGEKEIASQRIGDWVMKELRLLDEVAYVRFASIYRKFQDLTEFEQEIARLKANSIHTENTTYE